MKGSRNVSRIPLWVSGFLLVLVACGGGGGGSGGAAAPSNPLWISINTQNLDLVVTASQADLSGSAYCDACPPSEGAFGYCPAILPFRSSAVAVSWTNLTTGATGASGNAVISGSCTCLFSNCMTVYANHWTAFGVPLAMGENIIEIRASDGANAATDTVRITRTPAGSQGLAATAGKGEVTLQWESVAEATAYTLYWSTSPGFTTATATRISGVTSPYRHTGLSDNVTYYYAVSAMNGSYESPLSSIVLATPGWQAQPIALTAATMDKGDTSIALDASGKVHIHYAFNACGQTDGAITSCDSYHYNNIYLTNATGAWTPLALDGSPWVDADVAVTIDGSAQVGYAAFRGVTVQIAGAGDPEVVDAQGWCDSSLVIDTANNAHLAYYGNSSSTGEVLDTGELRYATNASGSWVPQTVDLFPHDIGCSQPTPLSLAVGTGGRAHVAYAGRSPDYGLKVASLSGGAWNLDTVDSGYITHLSSTVDVAGTAHIAYTDNFGMLKYAHPDEEGIWHIETIENANASAPSIALDAGGRLHISYVASYQLKVATSADSTWSRAVLDGHAHTDTALAVDSFGKVHISYFSGGSLKYITNR